MESNNFNKYKNKLSIDENKIKNSLKDRLNNKKMK